MQTEDETGPPISAVSPSGPGTVVSASDPESCDSVEQPATGATQADTVRSERSSSVVYLDIMSISFHTECVWRYRVRARSQITDESRGDQAAAGSVIVKVDPLPSVERTLISPPWARITL